MLFFPKHLLHFAGLFLMLYTSVAFSQDKQQLVDREVKSLMKEGNIPGISLVMVNGGQPVVRSYGYADAEKKMPVTPNTLFQLGSCSKAFTALAIQQLIAAGKIHPDSLVTTYLPWCSSTYKNVPAAITIAQLLHHTSGIPWQTIADIPAGNADTMLEATVRKVAGVKLHHKPGTEYEYATINYDILALILQKVTGQLFETYVAEKLLAPLEMHSSSVGIPVDSNRMAAGYKVGFFRARACDAPVFRGNNAAGYVIADANDMAKWLLFQMGRRPNALYPLALQTQQRDETVALHGMAAYGMGWEVSFHGDGAIFHAGLNPNFSAYIVFRPQTNKGVVLLANSNSYLTGFIAERVMKILAAEKLEDKYKPTDRGDKSFSLIALLLALYILGNIVLLVLVIVRASQGKRKLTGPVLPKLWKFLQLLLLLVPFMLGIYLLPRAIAGFNWTSILVWMPESFAAMIVMVLIATGITCISYLAGLLLPEPDQLLRMLPRIVLVSMLSGIANMVVIILVTSALNVEDDISYLLFYYALTMAVYLAGRWFVQVRLVKLTRGMVYDLRIKLIEKIFATSYQFFERIERGRIYTALQDDVDVIGNATSMLIMLLTNAITAFGAFLYLAALSLPAAALTFSLIIIVAGIYYVVGKRTDIYYSRARDTVTVFMGHLNGLIDGFKELSMHNNKRLSFKRDITGTAAAYRDHIVIADTRFVNAFLIGESMLILLLGITAFGIPRMFPDVAGAVVTGFVIVLLYLIGPINGILSAAPGILQLRVAWKRVKQFMQDVPGEMDIYKQTLPVDPVVQSIRAAGVSFHYQQGEDGSFAVGPIDLEISSGEVVFIIGGNGSGKTTLSRLLTGLYKPHQGHILINGKKVDSSRLGEYFSTVFSPAHLFEKIYDTDLEHRAAEISDYLQLLNLYDKVSISNNQYSTIALSGGQRKRLALLQCYLEDHPVYLFDEWAADQDPSYREFFYLHLLPKMKDAGKIVIAITHDDQYFHVADKVYKMNQGKLETMETARQIYPDK
ncbi:cyclic peptide transporter [Chitinophaga costaii]|uniref:Cyclic peptide transporter n=1 Tax=Chitinophaga costaii TaxID=1335309 RepID=A0A1C3YUC4_9BACT|nr:cyclic peptide export ABC transporter [Chitinophaga costaii]PUZ30110.1 cyclic peptide export ABC transporter [Chitinophaga costaii]SCB73706.1 cyclic peptide transporter [Chitinophaga costaii]